MSDYDETPYTGDPIPEAQPDRAFVVAALHGLTPPPLATARVLELGCGDGASLRAAALAAPGAEHVGLDLAGAHVHAGAQAAAELGLSNVRMVQGDLREAAALGRFDYVVAHGLFSWIPPELQRPCLETIGDVLAPGGVAYVSYNTLPGWALRGAVQSVLRRGTRAVAEPAARADAARALAELLAKAAPDHEPAWKALAQAEADFLRSGEVDPAGLRSYVTHEVLAEHNHPLWVDQFIEMAGAAGLAYLADANPHDGLRTDDAAVTAALAAQPDRAGREALADALECRYFRRSLLVRAGTAAKAEPAADAVRGLHVLSAARPAEEVDVFGQGPVTFTRRGGGSLATADGLEQAALVHLLERYPEAVPFAELVAGARATFAGRPRPDDEARLAALALRGVLGDVLELRAAPTRCRRDPSPKPTGCPLARRAARLGHGVFNVHHQRVPLDPLQLATLQRLDGTKDARAVAADLADAVASGALELDDAPTEPAALRAALEQPVKSALRFLGRAGLLLG